MKKVYCKNCKWYYKCEEMKTEPYIIEDIGIKKTDFFVKSDNTNNNCLNYEKLWYKFWI